MIVAVGVVVGGVAIAVVVIAEYWFEKIEVNDGRRRHHASRGNTRGDFSRRGCLSGGASPGSTPTSGRRDMGCRRHPSFISSHDQRGRSTTRVGSTNRGGSFIRRRSTTIEGIGRVRNHRGRGR